MAVSYDNLWSLLIRKGLSKKDFCNKVGITNKTLNKLELNLPIPVEILSGICEILECGFDDIVRNTGENSLITNFPDFDISGLFDDLWNDNEFEILGIKRSTDLPKPYTVKSIKTTLSKYIRECKLSKESINSFLNKLKKYNVYISIDEDVIPNYNEIPKKHTVEDENSQEFKIELQQAKNYVLWLSEQNRLLHSLEESAEKSKLQFNNLNVSNDYSKFVTITCDKETVEYKTAIDKAENNNGFPFNLIIDILDHADSYYFRYQYSKILEKIEELLDTLTPREAFVLKNIYGFSTALDNWFEALEIVDNEIIKNYIMDEFVLRPIRKLRHPARNKHINKYFFEKNMKNINLFDLKWTICYDSNLIHKVIHDYEYDFILGAYMSCVSGLKTKIFIISVLHSGIEKFHLFSIDCSDNIMKVDIAGDNDSTFKGIIGNIIVSGEIGLNTGGMLIEDLGLRVRSYNCLKRAGVNTLNDLAAMTIDDLMKVRNLGKKSVDEVISVLARYGLVYNFDGVIVEKEVINESIESFARFYNAIYGLNNTDNIHLLKDKFLERCSGFGFDLHTAEWFCEIFSEKYACLNNLKIIKEIGDSKILGSLILLKWQQIVNADEENLLLTDNRIWFIIAFNCLYNVAYSERTNKEKQEQEANEDLLDFEWEI